jgi:hypothetical protein
MVTRNDGPGKGRAPDLRRSRRGRSRPGRGLQPWSPWPGLQRSEYPAWRGISGAGRRPSWPEGRCLGSGVASREEEPVTGVPIVTEQKTTIFRMTVVQRRSRKRSFTRTPRLALRGAGPPQPLSCPDRRDHRPLDRRRGGAGREPAARPPRPALRSGDEPAAVLEPESDDALASWRVALERPLGLWA